MPRSPDATIRPHLGRPHSFRRWQPFDGSADSILHEMWLHLYRYSVDGARVVITDGDNVRSINLLTWRSDPMPPRAAPATPPATRAARDSHRTLREGFVNELRASQHEIIELPGFLRWHLFAAQKQNDQRIQLYAQPPAALTPLAKMLFRAGFSIDAIEYSNSFLHTTVRTQQQIPTFISLMQWLNNLLAMTPSMGLPPSPWRLEVAHCLVQRVRHADGPLAPPSSSPTNPASN